MANILELTKRAVDLEGLGELLHSSRVGVELVIIIVGGLAAGIISDWCLLFKDLPVHVTELKVDIISRQWQTIQLLLLLELIRRPNPGLEGLA